MKREEMRGRDMELERLRMREEAEARRRLERLLEAARRPIRDLPVHGVGLLTVGPNGEHFVKAYAPGDDKGGRCRGGRVKQAGRER